MASNLHTAYYYDQAILPPKWNICGVRLRPFCLGHFLMLRHLGSPLSSESESDVPAIDGIYWLFHALLVCGLSYEDNLELHADDALLKKTFEDFSENLSKNMEAEPGWNIYAKLNLFKQYMAWHLDMPIYTEEGKQNTSAPSGIDWVQNLFVIFKSKLGYTESEILNMCFRKLFYEWASYAESEGAIKVANKVTLDQYARAKGLI